jgi:chromate transport protein ChrA
MGALFAPIASLLGVETEALIQRLKESAVAVAAIALFALVCVVFLLVALYTALNWWLGPIWSPLIIAAGAFVIALVLYIALRLQQAALKRRAEERRKEAETTALLAGAALSALPELFHSSLIRNVGLPIALYAGVLLLSSGRRSKPPRED